MKTNIFFFLVTIVVLVGVNWVAQNLFGGSFIDYSFFIGLITTVLIWFFSSSGGFSSNMTRANIQGQTGIKLDEEKRKFNPSIPFYTALGYTIVFLIITFIQYSDYIIK